MEPVVPLNEQNIEHFKDRLSTPTYSREQSKTGMVHIGVGGFHRAHQAYYTHLLQEKDGASEWGICGIGLREGDRKMHDILKKQDCLYTLIEKHPDGKIALRIIGSITDFLLGVDDAQAVVNRMADAATKIVSLTITEGGYNFNPSTGAFDFENPDIQHELKHPDDPRTVYGFLTAALKKRRDDGIPAFTVMSCDNIEHNGDIARKMLLAFAMEQDKSLASWIEEEVCFPNSMVDRITPVTTPSDIAYLRDTYAMEDEWPVTCEPFIQWVIEDDFSNGRPEFEKVGVQFVPDVKPYEKMKLRLLNAGHSVLGILGAIHGHPTINACMEDATFVTFLRAFMDKEASPVLNVLEGIDLNSYKNSLEERFANPNIKDSVCRICSESSAKLPKFLIPTIQENLSDEGSIQYGTLVIAAWCYYSDKEVDQNGQPLEIIDVMQGELHEAARETENNRLAFVKQETLFGALAENERFTATYNTMLQALYAGNQVKKLMQGLL
ncbi:mannitol dehydrogenase family protein [Aggregatimonas sangjinii]|uniref:Mannitol dehydrogenase family protein n=1 Tax=Aggregatimonas sangjinii TaxID=2583587 RepID=A0A5B7SSE8_9FLAO|nr:mannitol dehydrogenase family protein [Aggregatimonas sangjinii]QCW99900.1 mannitol dehydrogenase family protein [Aggregatimonas sangjinii]